MQNCTDFHLDTLNLFQDRTCRPSTPNVSTVSIMKIMPSLINQSTDICGAAEKCELFSSSFQLFLVANMFVPAEPLMSTLQ